MAESENYQLEKLTRENKRYPGLLRQIHEAPERIFARGETNIAEMPCVAIVGTRKASSYGIQAAESITRDLAEAGICIVSGLAIGIDTIAHKAALATGGKTIAVLGSGIDDQSIYPRANLALAQKILKGGGLMLSEYEPGSPTYPANFPARNRIIAGLALMTVVIEAPFKSGALITARFALEENRDVGALPGPVTSRLSEGTNDFIAKGAFCIRNAEDVLNALGMESKKKTQGKDHVCASLEEKEICEALKASTEPLTVDKLKNMTTLDTKQIISLLNILALDDIVKNIGGERYILNK